MSVDDAIQAGRPPASVAELHPARRRDRHGKVHATTGVALFDSGACGRYDVRSWTWVAPEREPTCPKCRRYLGLTGTQGAEAAERERRSRGARGRVNYLTGMARRRARGDGA